MTGTSQKPTGRPPYAHTPEIAEQILERIAAGETLSAICREKGMPHRGEVWRWIKNNENGFGDNYARARQLQAESWADGIIEEAAAASAEDVQAAKLRVDTKKWLMARNHPIRFGDKVEQQHTGSVGVKLQWAESENDENDSNG